MKTASTLHILALGACFMVQFGAPDVLRMPGVRRHSDDGKRPPSRQADKVAVVRYGFGGIQRSSSCRSWAAAIGVLDIRDALKVLFEQEYQERLLSNCVAGVGYQ